MDPIFHNIFSLSRAKTFDLGSYDQGQTRKVLFPKAGIIDVYCHLHPNMEATIVVTPTNTVLISWPSPSTGFALQQNLDLAGTNWVTPSEIINDDGVNRSIIVTPAPGNRLFRLQHP